MAKLRIKALDGKTLVVQVPEGTDPTQYDALARSAVDHYMQSRPVAAATPSGFPEPQASDNPPAGAEVPFEQRLANNSMAAANGAALASGTFAIARGLGALGGMAARKFAGGLSGPMENGANWMAGRWANIPGRVLPENALKARDTVSEAADYALKPHPEVQQAIMDVHGQSAPVSDIPTPTPTPPEGGTGSSLVKRAPETGWTMRDRDPLGEESQLTSGAPALTSGAKALGPGSIELGGEGESTLKMAPYDKAQRANTSIPSGGTIEMPGETPPDTALSTKTVDPEVYDAEVMNADHSPAGEETEPPPTDEEVPAELGDFDRPLISHMSNADALRATEGQMETVGGAINAQLSKLDSVEPYNVSKTVKNLGGMYIKDGLGKIIPPGDSSAQAINNAAVAKAIETLKAEAFTKDKTFDSLPWQRANAIKGQLWNLYDQSNDPVYRNAWALVRDSIDEQAAPLLAKSGGNVEAFQTLRKAYQHISNIHSGLNNQVRGALTAKSSIPVLRTATAAGGIAAGHPGVAGAMAADVAGRAYGPQMMARALQWGSELGDGAAAAVNPSARRAASVVANGLAAADEDNQ